MFGKFTNFFHNRDVKPENQGGPNKKPHFWRIQSFCDQFGDTYDHPFNEDAEFIMLDWPSDD